MYKLIDLFDKEDSGIETAEVIRSLIEKITFTPDTKKDALRIDLHGDLAGILSFALNKDKSLIPNEMSLNKILLVAEEGLEPPTRGL